MVAKHSSTSGEEDGYWDPDTYQVLSLDPGGTTGWAVFSVHPDAMSGDPEIPILPNIELWRCGEFTGPRNSQIDQIVDLCSAWPDARLVTEDFVLRQLNAVLEPVAINAAIDWALRPRYWVYQMSSLAMSTVTDERQKAWGFWVPGKEHARDAVKHNITFLKRRKESAVKEAARSSRSFPRSGA